MKLVPDRKAMQYLFFEMWPSLILGIIVFISIMLMFQVLRYTEFVLIHGVSLKTMAELLTYVSISFIPALLPMSLIFSVLLTYGRLSQDSEIIALNACGIGMGPILAPALGLSFLVTILSLQTSFYMAPWGNRKFEVLIDELSQSKAGATIKEGTFSEGFFDLVVYANEVDSKSGEISKVFLFDERDPQSPLTVIAKTGQLIHNPEGKHSTVILRLQNGDIHKKSETHTKIKFDTFDTRLAEPAQFEKRQKSAQSLSIDEIRNQLQHTTNEETHRNLLIEFHRRWAIAIACLIFGALGVGLGVRRNQRHQKSSGLVISFAVVIAYWILYVTMENIARNGPLPATISIWTPNIIFSALSGWKLFKIWN